MVELSGRIKKLRLENNYTQKQVAEFLDIAPNSYQRFEYGKDNPSLENIIKLCKFFNTTADYLLGLSDDPTRH